MHVSSIRVYPVKSFRGIELDERRLVRRGLAGDRRWMVVDASGEFLTQRDLPEMALVRTALDGDTIVLEAPRVGPFRLPQAFDGERSPVQIWGGSVDAVAYPPARDWLKRALGVVSELVYMPDDVERPVNAGRAGSGVITGFNDAYPLLVVGEASLADLVARVGAPLPMSRFRPNIVVADAPPYDEDEWYRLHIGQVALEGVKRCDRCAITSVDPETGEAGAEPLHTLSGYRKSGGKVWFGMNLVHQGEGMLAVGDRVIVEERRAPDP